MTEDDRKVAIFVEDDPEDADSIPQLFQLSGGLILEHVTPLPLQEDYLPLVLNPDTGAIIIDQRLGEYAAVDYTGLQLARYLRTVLPGFPIYILTAYRRDIALEQEGLVDSVLKKGNIRKESKIWAQRIFRAMQQYDEALDARQRRFGILVEKKLNEGLDSDEEQELQELRAFIELPFGSAMIEHERKWEEGLQRDRDFLSQLESIVAQLGQETGQ